MLSDTDARRPGTSACAAGKTPPSIATTLAGVALLLSIGACAGRPPRVDPLANIADIHERIAWVSHKSGFINSIHTRRDAESTLDYTFLHFSLDGVKTRHHSLEALLRSIGGICAAGEFARLPISIEIRAASENDRIYLREALSAAVVGRPNISISLNPAAYTALIVAVAGR
jgi:hypothetical protein